MKISKNQTLGFLTFIGGVIGILGNNKATKIAGFGTGMIAGGILLKRMYKEESEKIESQCQETERVFNTTGLDPEKVETISLLTGTENGDPEFAKIILQEIWKSSALSDEMLEYNYDAYLNTLHIMQNVEKNRIIVSIPISSKNKSLSPKDIRNHFKQVFDEFISENNLDMENFLNSIGVVVTNDDSEPPYTYYEELLREDNETFPEYINRVISYQKESESGKKPKGLTLKENDTFLRIEQYLNLEFPVFPAHSNKKGLDLFSAVKLIKLLTETTYIKSTTGREVAFDLNRVAFHPTDDYGTIYVIKGGSIETIDL